MRSRNLFLLVYFTWSCFSSSDAHINATCAPSAMCGQDPTQTFLQCVGLPSTDTGRDHVHRLKHILEATMDIYTFMKSSMKGVPVLSLQGALHLNRREDPHQNEAVVQMWLEVKLKPLLHSITKHFLSCLSTKNFSCSTYQTVVKELSHHFSEMNPVRQKWIYTFFMYPFLSGDRVDGCVRKNETSEDWLMKNFGAFKAMARLQDFSTLNMAFSGLEVLSLLSPVQQAELLMRPEVASLDNATLTLIFHNLLTGGCDPTPTALPGGAHKWTTPLYPPTHYPPMTDSPYLPSSPHSGLREVVSGFMTAFKPIGSFVHDFVTLTRERDVSQIKSTIFTQFLLNWTLSELADMYRPTNASVGSQAHRFDVTDVEDWYQQVVMPLLRRFLPNAEALMHENVKLAFHQVFYLDHGMDPNEDNGTSILQDVCSITLDKAPCGLTDAVVNVANVLHCAASTNLTMTEATTMRLVHELTGRLNSLVRELAKANFSEVASDFRQIFTEEEPPTLPQQHLSDPSFIALWFKVKLLPLLPAIPIDILSCLSTKNFTCPVFHTLVEALGHHMSVMNEDPVYSHNIYRYFIYQHLRHRNGSDPQCVSSANHSAEWLLDNFGFFSRFAPITDFYWLNPSFSGLDVLHLLTPNQTAQLLLLPLRTPPEKDVVINRVFDFLLESPEDRRLSEVLSSLVRLAREVDPPCSTYRHIFERLYKAVASLPPRLEALLWASINELINITPDDCLPANITCLMTQYNASRICHGIHSSGLESHLNMSMDVPCNFTLETYACAQENFTAYQLASLLKCNLPGNSSHSRMIWKMLLSKSAVALDPALDILANMPMSTVVPSATEVLDVIREIRLNVLSDEQLRNQSVITKWFSMRLSRLLPAASAQFLSCLSLRNLSCHSYQQILQVFSHHFDKMTLKQQEVVLNEFILPFLSHSGPSCVSMSNSSADWLMKNLGPFSRLFPVKKLFELNPYFNPLEVLQLLTPTQNAELLVLSHVTLQDKDAIISMIFDYLPQSPDKAKFTQFLSDLVLFLPRGNLSCSSYKKLFDRLDLALDTVPLDVAREIIYTKMALSRHIPPGCVIYSGQCHVTVTNETDICRGVNSTAVQLLLNGGQMSGGFCHYSVEEFGCASLSALKAEDLAELLACNRTWNSTSSTSVWKLLLSKASNVLDEALDLLANKTLDPRNPALTIILDSIREVRLDTFDSFSFNNPAFIKLWFSQRLRPLLPAVSSNFLSCLTAKGLDCSAYQHIVQILSRFKENMSHAQQMSVYTHFIKIYLINTNITDPGCRSHSNNSADWLQKNLGAFSSLVSFHDMQMLHLNFSAMEALPYLTVRQLAEVSSTPGQLTSAAQVNMLMKYVHNQQLPSFFDDFSPAIMFHENSLHSAVIPAMLQVVFDRANLSDPSVSDSVVWQWLHNRLQPLLFNLSPDHVAPFFSIVVGRNCSIQVQGVQDLNSTISSLSENTQTEIHNHIIQMLKGPKPLQCYGDNYNHSFYVFVENSFAGFKFPNLTSFLSLMPHNRRHQLMNSMPPPHLGNFLRRPDVVDDDMQLCVIYSNYVETPMFLEKESLPAAVMRPTLPCVWPMALSSSKRSEVNRWFDQSLKNYLVFLTKNLISPDVTYNASCLAFQKLVSVLGEYNYDAVDFMRLDMYNTIRTYLTSANMPRCYNSSDPELSSTAWFAQYIGLFLQFLSLEDFQAFGSEQFIQVFTVNLVNIALFNQTTLPLNLTNYYTQLVYQQDSNFNPLHLPLLYRCVAPGPAFTQLSAQESMIVLYNLTTLCTDLDPQISAALAGNLGENIDANAIITLGNQSTGLSTGQLMMIKPQDLMKALGTLGLVNGWNRGQANAIIQLLLSSGMFQLNSASSFLMLGSLVVGIPSTLYSGISGTELLNVSKHSSVVGYLLTSSQIVQQTFVTQIITVNSNSDAVVENIPDELATEIPPVLLLGFSNNGNVFKKLNKKKWKKRQAELFFSLIATESAAATLGGANGISSSVLQGFTCLSVSTFKKSQVKKLIKGCRRKGRAKVPLVETQLTCMYNYLRKESDAISFDLYPPDVLLYYDYSLVPRNTCRDYFTQLGDADFSIFSSALIYKRNALFTNAQSCLGITNTSLIRDTVKVLGKMCCILDGSYIENSDPYILENLKSCADLTNTQVKAVEAVLMSGKTQYNAPSTWNLQTLEDLGMLPLHLTSTFYDNFNKKTKERFLKYFLKVLRKNKVSKQKRKKFRKEIRKSIRGKTKRSISNSCTTGNITRVTISDETFTLNYDTNQFNACLSVQVVKNNLAALTDLVDQEENSLIILSKLREGYSSHSTIPESQVKLLGLTSRMASISDINMWNITEIDTIAALMDSEDGEWEPSLAKAIISKYLSVTGNKLGSAELNSLRGPNLCTQDVDILRGISTQSIKEANALDILNCTKEKKKAIFAIAEKAFTTSTRSATISSSSYQLLQSYLPGADLNFIKSLVSSNVNMDMSTFTNLDEDVVLKLTVSEVQALLGSNLNDLKSYENQTLVSSWIRLQPQSQLDTLGLGLTGGRTNTNTTVTPTMVTNEAATTATRATVATTATTTTTTTATTTTTVVTTTGSHGARVCADIGLFFLALISFFITSQHMLV